MPESNAETQVRLGLETECSRALDKLIEIEGLRCPITLIAFDFGGGPGVPFSNVAFKTSLPIPTLVATVESLLASWASGRPRVVDVRKARLLRLPDGSAVVRCATAVGLQRPGRRVPRADRRGGREGKALMGLIVPPDALLVDALGNPLRTEPEPSGTFANEAHAALSREAMEAAARALLPEPRDPFEYRPRFPIMPLVPLLPFRIVDVLDDSSSAEDQAGPEPAEGEPHR